MELDNLKSAWKDVGIEVKHTEELKLMLIENRHPVLKSIKRQLSIELMLWPLFLFIYYDGFDGDQKPLYANILLVLGISSLLVHNIIGYFLNKNLVIDDDINKSLQGYLKRVKEYAIMSVASKVFAFAAILVFFSSVITFNGTKYGLLMLLLVIACIQLFMQYRIWDNRIRTLRNSMRAFIE